MFTNFVLSGSAHEFVPTIPGMVKVQTSPLISEDGMGVPFKVTVSEVEEFSVMTNCCTWPCAMPPKSIAPATRVAAQIKRREFIF
jgi:hypothetical protein